MNEFLKSHYEYLVLGAGSGGLAAAVGLHLVKKDVLLVSPDIGGECTHAGCIPSKEILHLAKSLDGMYEDKKDAFLATIFKTVQKKILEVESDDKKLIEGIEYIEGYGVFKSGRSVSVTSTHGERVISFDFCVISTGSKPATFIIPGLDTKKVLTNENIFLLDKIPMSLTILGGGPIGCEMATAFAMLGTKVTIISSSPLLPRESRECVKLVEKEFDRLGIVRHIGFKATELKENRFWIENKVGERRELPVSDFYLQSIGRVPTTNLGLEHGKVAFSEDGIGVDSNFKTSNSRVYAIGDCTPAPKFTHLATYQAQRFVMKRLFPFLFNKQVPLPRVTFTLPVVASVGETEEKGLIQKFSLDFSQSDRGKIEETQLLYGEVFVHMITGRIVGACVVGEFAEHIVNFFTLAILKKTSVFNLGSFISPYPTYFNEIQKLYPQFVYVYFKDLKKNVWAFVKEKLSFA